MRPDADSTRRPPRAPPLRRSGEQPDGAPRPLVARALPLASLCALGLTAVLPAQAHEAPRGIDLVWSDDDPDALPVMLGNRGLIFPPDDERGWSLRCNEAYGLNTAASPVLMLTGDGTLLLATSSGLVHSSDRGCHWQGMQDLADTPIGDMTRAPDGALWLASQDFEAENWIWRSLDDGQSWQPHAPNASDEAFASLRVGSDGRMVATGQRVDHEALRLWPLWASSSDAGSHWEVNEIPSERALLALHPEGSRVFSVQRGETRDLLLRSDAQGDETTVLLELPSLAALTLTPDGSHVWVGATRSGGLWQSSDGGGSFTRVHESLHSVSCLVFRQQRLWLCGADARGASGLWVSGDLGESFEPVMDFSEVDTPVDCSDGVQAARCLEPWLDWEREVLVPAVLAAGTGPDTVGSGGPDDQAGAAAAGGEPTASAPDTQPSMASCQSSRQPGPRPDLAFWICLWLATPWLLRQSPRHARVRARK